MALFKKKTWQDRIVEFAGRRTLVDVETEKETLVDVYRSEGAVSQAGDAFSGGNMNGLEQRISDAFGTVLTGTLAANAATLTFTNVAIKNTSLIDVYTDVYGVVIKGQAVSGNMLTLTFKPQNVSVGVKVIVRRDD